MCPGRLPTIILALSFYYSMKELWRKVHGNAAWGVSESCYLNGFCCSVVGRYVLKV